MEQSLLIPEASLGFMDYQNPDLKNHWMVTGAFTEQFEFLGAEDNYDVQRIIERAGIAGKNTTFDSESCQLFAYFKSKRDGEAFVKRVNRFLTRKHAAVAKARRV